MKAIRKKSVIILFGIIIFAGLVFLLLFMLIPRYKNLSDFETVSFNEKSEKLMNFFEEIDNNKEEDEEEIEHKLIAYTMENHFAESNSQTMSADEVQSFIDQSFVNKPSILDYINRGADPSVPDNHIYFNEDSKTFEISKDLITHKEAISQPISKYIQTSVKKKKNLLKATYAKYIFDDPYDIIDHTSQFDIKSTHSVKDYLSGNGTNLALKELLTNETIQGISEPQKEITVIFELQDNQLKISDYSL